MRAIVPLPRFIRDPLRWVYHRARMARLRPWRPEWLPASVALQREAEVHPHVVEEQAGLFLSHNMGSTEVEVLNWLHASACLLKPDAILETGAFDGLGTIALASACRANGKGHVHSVEIDPERCRNVRRRLKRQGLSEWATLHAAESLSFLKDCSLRFDLAFFDSLIELRAAEFEACLSRGLLGRMAVFHDSSLMRSLSAPDSTPRAAHDLFRERVFALIRADKACTGYFESTLSRGLIVVHRNPELRS